MAKKPTVTTLQSGFNSTETLNANFEALRDGFDNTLSLDGSTPNAMEADLDLNGNNIIGAAGLLINGTDYLSDVEAAKAAALVAQAAAELAETNAETAETNAESSETASGLSATAAATSETNAGASETAASGSATASATSATNSATSASEAAASASAASTSETNAATSETNAATSETNAATSATESETAKTAAEAAKDAALAALDSFDDRYLGAKASDPTLDNDGNALVAGALYYNTTDDSMKVYEGSMWVAAYASLSGALLQANNLSDISSFSSARTNLGLGTNDSPTFGGLDVIGGTDTTIRAVIGGGDQALLVVNGDRDNDGDAGPEDSAILLATDGVYSSSVNSGFGNYGYRIGTINSGGVTGLKFTEAKAGVDIERMRINTDGRVGIGTNNPSTALDVDGTVTATGVDVTGTITSDGLTVDVPDGDGVTLTGGTGSYSEESYYWAQSGRAAFGYDGSAVSISDIGYSGTTSNKSLRVSLGGADRLFVNHSTGDISFYEDTGTTPKFFWDASAERLGIGTSSPSEELSVAGDISATNLFVTSSGDTSGAGISGGFKHGGINSKSLIIEADPNNVGANTSMRFEMDGSEAMRIDSSGRVGIGKTNPATPLDVNGTVTATAFAGDGSALTGIAAGATGGGNDDIFYENGQNVTTNYTITNGKNAMSAGPITVDSGVTVTVGAGEVWTVV